MAKQRNLKVIAAFRAFRGAVIGSAGIAISAQTEQSFADKIKDLQTNMDIASTSVTLLRHELDASNEYLIGYLAVVCLVWALLLFVQAYGLWNGRHWAVWLAFATSIIVLVNIAWITTSVLGVKNIFLLAGNLLVAMYLLHLLRRKSNVSQ
ncbi:MAG: DUF2127 domain-containing protein [Betaproteobacteria bacterium]